MMRNENQGLRQKRRTPTHQTSYSSQKSPNFNQHSFGLNQALPCSTAVIWKAGYSMPSAHGGADVTSSLGNQKDLKQCTQRENERVRGSDVCVFEAFLQQGSAGGTEKKHFSFLSEENLSLYRDLSRSELNTNKTAFPLGFWLRLMRLQFVNRRPCFGITATCN